MEEGDIIVEIVPTDNGHPSRQDLEEGGATVL